MCGICGVASRESTREREERARAAASLLQHRGPDAEGCYSSTWHPVTLAHRRLSIIDLSAASNQPFTSKDGRTVLTYNGELYNHNDIRKELARDGVTFRTTGDTEVIVAAYQRWGVGCLDRFDGMFAFCVYDANRGTLFLARDRMGEKPLFFRSTPDTLAFASEQTSLLKLLPDKPRLSRRGIEHYLAYGFFPAALAAVDGVEKLAAAEALEWSFSSGELRRWKYWTLPKRSTQPMRTEPELIEEADRLISGSVRSRLLAADVPVAVLLSGGIDSGLVAAYAADVHGPKLRTFTVSVPGTGSLDEGPVARAVATRLAVNHTELAAGTDTAATLEDLARDLDEPLANHALLPTLVLSRLLAKHAKVALTGDGGDELFGGYPHYRRLIMGARLQGGGAGSLIRLAAKIGEYLPAGVPGRNALFALAAPAPIALSRVNLLFDRSERASLLSALPPFEGGRPEDLKAAFSGRAANILEDALRADCETTLADDYLMKVDRASMLASLETRSPFLDHKVAEFAFRDVPSGLKATMKTGKVLLRQLARRRLPEAVWGAPKRGFMMPLSTWVRRDWAGFVDEFLLDGHSLFSAAVVHGLRRQLALGFRVEGRLFALLMFEMWRRNKGLALA